MEIRNIAEAIQTALGYVLDRDRPRIEAEAARADRTEPYFSMRILLTERLVVLRDQIEKQCQGIESQHRRLRLYVERQEDVESRDIPVDILVRLSLSYDNPEERPALRYELGIDRVKMGDLGEGLVYLD